jgi:hypothetical protein
MTPVSFELQGHSFEEVGSAEGQAVYAQTVMDTAVATDVVAVAKNRFPAPPGAITAEDPVTAQLRRRWRNVVQGTESPVAVGYFVKTTIERHLGKPPQAPKALNISSKVWDELSKLTSTDDPEFGRKAGGRPGQLTEVHLSWLRFACPIIIRRVLEHEAGMEIPDPLTKADLTSLA